MGALHLRYDPLRDHALRGATAQVGALLAVDRAASTVRVHVDAVRSRALPRRSRALRRVWERWFPPPPGGLGPRTFEITPPPVATDAWSHPLFVRVAGEVGLHELVAGQRVAVVAAVGVTAVLREDPVALDGAFDRAADLAWAAAARDGELHDAVLDPARGDVALDELRWRGTLDLPALCARSPLPSYARIVPLADDPAVRRRLVRQAADALARSGDRAALGELLRGLLDRIRFHELVPLLSLLDPSRPEDAPSVALAQIRIAQILREEPHRAGEFAAVSARLGTARAP